MSLGLAFILWKNNSFSKRWLGLGLVFLLVDLYGYAWFDIKRDFAAYHEVAVASPIVEELKAEQANGSLGRLYGYRKPDGMLPLVPSINMLNGFEDIGAYSPLVMKRYHETIGQFGNVNDSNLAFSPSPSFFLERLPLLNSLDVSHILSSEPIQHTDWAFRLHDPEERAFLYANQKSHTRAHFVDQVTFFSSWKELRERLMEPGFNPRRALLLESSEAEKLDKGWQGLLETTHQEARIRLLVRNDETESWQVVHRQPGFFVLTNTMYPGWQAKVKGRKTPILKADKLLFDS